MALVFSQTNIHLTPAPPSYFLPNSNGSAIPANGVRGQLAIDLGGTIPPGESFKFAIERRDGGVWSEDATADLTTGPYSLKGAPPTTINYLNFSMRAVDSSGNPVGPYPQRWRVRVDQSGDWIVPSVTLTTS